MKALLVMMALLAGEDGGTCFDNLCGMDSYCSCHRQFAPDYQGQARCYATSGQCSVDLACCKKQKCKGSPARGQPCTDAVVAAVRDGGTR